MLDWKTGPVFHVEKSELESKIGRNGAVFHGGKMAVQKQNCML